MLLFLTLELLLSNIHGSCFRMHNSVTFTWKTFNSKVLHVGKPDNFLLLAEDFSNRRVFYVSDGKKKISISDL